MAGGIGDLVSILRVFLRFLFILLAFIVALPFGLLNLPIGVYARFSAHKHAKDALANSTVKISGKDVMASKKVRGEGE
jgi:glycerol-3-phosphate O-acyltransferase/dihydroxyacetone phosphate acyltransferase